MSIQGHDRKRIVENFKKGILTDGFDIYHCAASDKYIVRKSKADPGKSQAIPATIPTRAPDPKPRKFGSFIV